MYGLRAPQPDLQFIPIKNTLVPQNKVISKALRISSSMVVQDMPKLIPNVSNRDKEIIASNLKVSQTRKRHKTEERDRRSITVLQFSCLTGLGHRRSNIFSSRFIKSWSV